MLFSFILHFYPWDKAWTSKNVDAYLIVLFLPVLSVSILPQFFSVKSEAFFPYILSPFQLQVKSNSEQRYLYILGALHRLLIC